MTSKEVSQLIIKFLQDTNRPWTFNDIVEKCGKNFGKSTNQKALDKLVSDGAVVEKVFGKQKIFFIKQDDGNIESTKNFSEMNKKLNNLQDDLKLKNEEIQKLEIELKKFSKIISVEELEKENKEIQEEIDEFSRILKNLNESAATVSTKEILSLDEIKKIDQQHEQILSTYKKRKRICGNMMDAIMEGYPKTKKQLIEEVGIETDENVGFKIEN